MRAQIAAMPCAACVLILITSGATCQASGQRPLLSRRLRPSLADEDFALVCSTCADTGLSTLVVRESFCFGGHPVTRLLMPLYPTLVCVPSLRVRSLLFLPSVAHSRGARVVKQNYLRDVENSDFRRTTIAREPLSRWQSFILRRLSCSDFEIRSRSVFSFSDPDRSCIATQRCTDPAMAAWSYFHVKKLKIAKR